ncbi:TatD family hydrolase [Fluviicola chungangensis]|uniref:TatD family deoxyribonuclease n=1 Tax=Fluviicola chungangensis TaxID=2597671 RepID=A0A556MJ64_9FLAO|nr:TatD family hydrolase [Fluviicola chungangensis]TSJ39938.1 TatD family deoxyribonuclease [Fluviicola chungangensis]
MFIDTHTHLYSEQFDEDRTAMIQRAIAAGVERMYMPNIDLNSIEGMHALEKQFPENCFAMMGLHPCSVDANWELVLAKMKLFLEKRPYVAVGEIGIDLYWDKTFLEEQKEVFRTQINWAKELQIPIVIHARDSFPEIYEVLDQENDERLKGIFHCFTGNEQDVQKILDYQGFSFGIGGVVTYKKSDLPETLKHIPLDKLLLETDAPYLAPTPFRGKRNESAYVVHTAEKVAEMLGLSLNKLKEITTKNAMGLFHP